ncbi:MAG TPA: hypothetical protein VK498_09155, partial [Ferruginibacter sp.]|nr:hypothetical protein [Ferruginibacter sp.]
LQNIILSKIAELEEAKKNNPVVNYKMFNNSEKTEYIIDFLESQGPGSALHMVEWNAYRYKIFTTKSGNKGLILLGISLRAYDNKIKDFFGWLKDGRLKNINKLIEFNIPEVTISNIYKHTSFCQYENFKGRWINTQYENYKKSGAPEYILNNITPQYIDIDYNGNCIINIRSEQRTVVGKPFKKSTFGHIEQLAYKKYYTFYLTQVKDSIDLITFSYNSASIIFSRYK